VARFAVAICASTGATRESVAVHLRKPANAAIVPEPQPGGTLAAAPFQLSAREVEVLRLIAAGRNNREIATELVLSVRTVDTHVEHILEKTQTANRTEAAILAYRSGLMS